MRILVQNRDYGDMYGGDKVLTDGLLHGLKDIGLEADYKHEWTPDLSSYDVVHLWHANMGWTVHQARNCKRQNKPYVITTIYYPDYNDTDLKEVLDGASFVISNSSNERAEILAKYQDPNNDYSRFVVLPNGIEDVFMRYDVFVAGRYESFKGQLKVIQACKQLGLPVVTAGSLGDQSYKDQCLAENYGTVLDNLTPEQMAEQYRKSRVYVCASLHERNSVTCTEAKAMGCKLVVTEGNRANPELKPDVTFDPDNFEELVRKLEEVYSDYPITFDQLAIRYLDLYKKATL